MSDNAPLKAHRLVALALCWAFGVVGGSVGLNGLIKGNQAKARIRKSVPAGVTVNIDTNNIYHAGVVLTTLCTLISVLASVFFVATLLSGRRPLATRTLPLQAGILAFCALWLLPTQIAYTVFFANDTSGVTAFLGSLQLPPSIIQAAQEAEGVTPVYRKLYYLRLVAVLPWFTWLFTVIAAGVLFAAARRRQPPAVSVGSAGASEDRDEVQSISETEKGAKKADAV
ncbi:hypothetical protein FA95DRAFT_1489479 [Auriscalpium vulgare]|uniref:Uncharacterized protein n=1 Tax=Auriscalpium vulgare TaxID=40419 RepID=A0ACB8RZ70_9AGAM|nr:hypothetical protein FA95DRAFT_1489479 [Auriscalpium vulgare]